MFKLTVDPMSAPDAPEKVAITFEAGVPISVNGKSMLAGRDRASRSTKSAGRNGVGRVDLVENRLVGIKSRGVYETPGGTLLVTALKALESITLDRDTAHEKERIATRYAELVYFGQWFSPLKRSVRCLRRLDHGESHRDDHAEALQRQRDRSWAASRRIRSTSENLA